MRRGRLGLIPLAVGPLLGLAITVPAAAGTVPAKFIPAVPGASHAHSATTIPDIGPSARAGFVSWQNPGVNHFTTFNTAGGVVAVNPGVTGQYQVVFHQLGFPGGNVQISTEDVGGTCAIQSWGPSAGDLDVNVDCYDTTGAPADMSFDMTVTQPNRVPNGVFDYDWVNKSHGSLTGIYQYNSSHRTNSVRNPHPGQYLVTMPGPAVRGANTGTVKVSAYGAGGGNCQLAGWHGITTGQQISVHCFSASGTPQNRLFTVVYVRGNNLMGVNGKIDANAFANGTAALYQPAVQYDSQRHARVTVVHLDRGLYEVFFVGSNPTGHFSGGLGDLQLAPVRGGYVHCGFAAAPTHTPFALVACANGLGQGVNTAFIMQWVVN